MSKRRALVTGVSGQDGALLARLLLDKGYAVTGTSRDADAQAFGNLRHLGIHDQVARESLALNDFRSVIQLLMKVQPDEIYNLAGQSSVGLSFLQPVETLESISMGTLNLLEGVRLVGQPVRIYNAGSSECFGETDASGADETTAFRPRSPYAIAKATAFWQVTNYREAYGLHACSGILFNHESGFRPERFVTRKIVAAACRIKRGSGEKLMLGDLSVQRDWGWAPEYVEAMWAMLQLESPQDFVIATGETNSLRTFARTTFELLDLDFEEFVVSDDTLLRPSDIRFSRGLADKARTVIGWEAKMRMRDVVAAMIEAEFARSSGSPLPRHS